MSDPALNPRTYPARHPGTVDAEVNHSERQRSELEALMAASGQTGSIVVAPIEALPSPQRGAYSSTTWAEGTTTVLQQADVVVLFELPATVDGPPTITRVRWSVVARVCGATCWRTVPDLEPPRVITSRWPSPAELSALKALSLPDPPGP